MSGETRLGIGVEFDCIPVFLASFLVDRGNMRWKPSYRAVNAQISDLNFPFGCIIRLASMVRHVADYRGWNRQQRCHLREARGRRHEFWVMHFLPIPTWNCVRIYQKWSFQEEVVPFFSVQYKQLTYQFTLPLAYKLHLALSLFSLFQSWFT